MGDMNAVMSSPYVQILVVLSLSFLMGLEREEHKVEPGVQIAAGVRTFPLIALLGYLLVVLSPTNLIPASVGLLAVAAFLLIAYQHKQAGGAHGFTSEVAALVAYAMGALIARNEYWIAATVTVADVLLLSGKESLRGLAQRLDRRELITFAKFLLLSAVILPIVPNRSYTAFDLNPFRTWLIVVVVSGMSYGSYLLQRAFRSGRSAVLSALLGGAYSSTLTTVTLAKQSLGQNQPRLYAGCIVLASAVMYIRIGVLIFLFNRELGTYLLPALIGLALLSAVTAAVTIATRREAEAVPVDGQTIGRNPLELSTAFVFAGLFVLLSVVTRLASQHLGSAGVYGLAGIMGVTDIDPFILGLAQSGGAGIPVVTVALAVLLATLSNNVVKGIYATTFGGRKVGLPALVMLTLTGAAGIAVFAWLRLM